MVATVRNKTPQHPMTNKVFGCDFSLEKIAADDLLAWSEANIQIARMTLTIKLDMHWNTFQLASRALPPSARRLADCEARLHAYAQMLTRSRNLTWNHVFSVCTT
jgi:hypothetical protein